jgi:hypothetical protein
VDQIDSRTGENLERARQAMGHQLREVNSKDVEDTDILKVYVSRYWKIVQTNIVDMVPKIIVTFMVKKFMKKSTINMQS